MEEFDLPTLGIEIELFDGFVRCRYGRSVMSRQLVGTPFRGSTCAGVQDRQAEGGIAPLLSDRRQHLDAPKTSLDVGMIVLADGDPVRALDSHVAHFISDAATSVTGQTGDTGDRPFVSPLDFH